MSYFRVHIKELPYTMKQLYSCAGTSKQAYFASLRRRKKASQSEADLISQVKEARNSHPGMGSRPLYYLIRPNIGINKFEKLVRKNHLTIRPKKKFKLTTDGNHRFKTYPNLVEGKVLDNINQVWATDITYYITVKMTFYITLIKDVYSRFIVGWHVSERMITEEVINALKMAIKTRAGWEIGLIHHSDKGGQFCSMLYTDLLSKNGILISNAENCLENPYAERINGTVKNQYLTHYDVKTLAQVLKRVNRIVYLYNYKRPHSSLHYSTPAEFEARIANMPKELRPKETIYNFNKK